MWFVLELYIFAGPHEKLNKALITPLMAKEHELTFYLWIKFVYWKYII